VTSINDGLDRGMPDFAVVIPAYNEAASIRALAERALVHCPRVVVVDDGSRDGTAAALAGLDIVLLRHDGNRGKAAALWSGIHRALALGAAAAITLDGDGQHAPEDVPRFIAAAERCPRCIVVGVRQAVRSRAPLSRFLANRFADFWLSWACGQRLRDSQSGFRLYPAALFDGLELPHDRAHGFVLESEILIEAAWRGFPVMEVPIAAIYLTGNRASHFRRYDVLRITRMVAGRLLRRGLYLPGLWRAFRRPRPAGGAR
jgi:glycosyltransferase involved in cell wall biosynthesis